MLEIPTGSRAIRVFTLYPGHRFYIADDGTYQKSSNSSDLIHLVFAMMMHSQARDLDSRVRNLEARRP